MSCLWSMGRCLSCNRVLNISIKLLLITLLKPYQWLWYPVPMVSLILVHIVCVQSQLRWDSPENVTLCATRGSTSVFQMSGGKNESERMGNMPFRGLGNTGCANGRIFWGKFRTFYSCSHKKNCFWPSLISIWIIVFRRAMVIVIKKILPHSAAPHKTLMNTARLLHSQKPQK